MMGRLQFHLALFIVFISSVLGQDVCVKKKSCSCVFPNGTGIDITPATTTYNASSFQLKDKGYKLTTYHYHPCYDVSFPDIIKTPNTTCVGPLAICRSVYTLTPGAPDNPNASIYVRDVGVVDKMGTSNDTAFGVDGSNVYITYINGPSNTVNNTKVYLICAESENKLVVASEQEPNAIVLSLYSKEACLKQIEEPGRSFGSSLLIIFFSGVIFYLVLGICTKKFLMGATGIEVIPNLAFWTDLPNLVRDGWLFTLSGFKLPPRGSGPVTSPDPNSYDSI